MISSVVFTGPSSVRVSEAEEGSFTQRLGRQASGRAPGAIRWPPLGNFMAVSGALRDRLRGGSHGRRQRVTAMNQIQQLAGHSASRIKLWPPWMLVLALSTGVAYAMNTAVVTAL